jgi:hypothetical protein
MKIFFDEQSLRDYEKEVKEKYFYEIFKDLQSVIKSNGRAYSRGIRNESSVLSVENLIMQSFHELNSQNAEERAMLVGKISELESKVSNLESKDGISTDDLIQILSKRGYLVTIEKK